MSYTVYVPSGADDKVSRFRMDRESGALTLVEAIAMAGGPSALCTSPDRATLYVSLRGVHKAASYAIDKPSGALTPINEVTLPADPCFLSTDKTGRFLLMACYGAGQVGVYALGEDGAIGGEPLQWFDTTEHAHCIHTDATNRYAYVPHTNPPNQIRQFLFDETTGTLTPNGVDRVCPDAPIGPRHYDYHPSLDVVYVSNENGSAISAYYLDPESGRLAEFQRLTTLPAEGFGGSNTCAQIHVSPDGRFVYISNRGHDSIACYAIDGQSGSMTPIRLVPTEPIPRVFSLDPSGRFLLAAGQASGKLATYTVDQETGDLAPLDVYEVGVRPMWVMVLDLER